MKHLLICRYAAYASIALAATVASVSATATALLTNLVVNGDAETNPGSGYSNTVVPSGWTTTSNFTAALYSVGGSSDLNTAYSAAVGGGLNFFSGGLSNGLSTAMQLINISDLAASIDAGGLTAAFSALIGGYANQGDNIVINAIFQDALHGTLSTQTLGPITATDRGNQSELLARSTNSLVPTGARFVEILMTSTRLDGSYNDGYADNLSFVLRGDVTPPTSNVPEPGSLALLSLGLAGLAAIRKRKQA